MKLTIIGGGGVRSMFLAKSIAQRTAELHITELVFMDSCPERLNIYGEMARQVALRLDPALSFTLTDDAGLAVKDADYVITTIRPGGDDMRIQDERIALSQGILGQETTGAAGLSFAMRSVPVLAQYCDLIKRYAKPTVKVFNFTNPAGVVSQTLRDMGYDFTFGICDAPSGLLHQIADFYGVSADRVEGECYGLNHLSFFSSIYLDGKDVMQDLIHTDEAYQKTDLRFFEKSLVQHMGCVLNEYLYYFFYREQAVRHILNSEETRGELIRRINEQMTAELKRIDIRADFDKALACFEHWYGKREDAYMASETGVKRDKAWSFDLYSQDQGGYAGVALKFIEIAESNRRGSMILCVPNRGAIPDLLDSDVVEISCDITKEGFFPHHVEQPDPRALELIRRVKSYERLASLAIRTKDKAHAIDALMLHPLVNSYSLAKQLVDQYIELNEDYSNGWQ